MARYPDAANGVPYELYDEATARAKVKAAEEVARVGRIADPLVRRFAARHLPKLKRRYRPLVVLVFGSRARGEALAESDLDLLVVSDRFLGIPFLERAPTLLAELDPSFAVDVLCYTPDEFARKRRELGIVSLAAEEGVRL